MKAAALTGGGLFCSSEGFAGALHLFQRQPGVPLSGGAEKILLMWGRGPSLISAPDRNLICRDLVSGAVDAVARGPEKKQRYPGTEGASEGGNVLFGDGKRRAPMGTRLFMA